MTSVNQFRLALVGLVFNIAVPLWAGEPAYDLDIEPQPLAKALKAFAEQSGLQVVYYSELADGEESPEVSGMMTANQAMAQLLASTDLTFDTMGEDTVVIETVMIGVSDQGGASDLKNLKPQPVLMAQNAGSQKLITTDGSSDVGKQDEVSRQIRTREDVIADEEQSRETRGQIETIVVVGSRNTGIRRYENDAQPYVIFNTVDIEASSASTIEDFLKTRLPMNATQSTFSQGGDNVRGNQSRIDLRGLGPNQTLILVNGRRLPGVSIGRDIEQPDINGIPLSAVERIEVLPATAAGIYGGGATGGAINIILRRDYSGFSLAAGYDSAFDTDTARTRLEGSAGFSLEGGRTNIIFSASHSESNPLLVRDRRFAERGRSLLFANDPDTYFTLFSPPVASTPNIKSADGSDLILDDGTPLNSPFTFVPVGYTGIGSDNGIALLANAGQYNLALSNDFSGGAQSLLNNPSTESYSLNVRRQFTDSIELFFDGAHFGNEGRSLVPAGLSSVLINPDAPTNPFTTRIRVAVPYTGISAEQNSETETTQLVGGATVGLPREWAMQGEYGWSRSTTESVSFAGFLKRETILAFRSGDDSVGDVDILRDLTRYPLGYSGLVFEQPTVVRGPVVSELKNFSLRFSGPTVALSGGQVTVSALLETREESVDENFIDQTFNRGNTLSLFSPAIGQDVQSAYVEATIPFVSAQNRLAGLEILEVQTAVRYDRYSTSSPVENTSFRLESRDADRPDIAMQATTVSSTDYTLGVRYSPAESTIIRASFGTGFLPPSVSQIPQSQFTSTFVPTQLVDPRRGGVLGSNTLPIEITTGGNAALVPEESESLSFGAIITPTFLPGLRVSADYTRIRKTDEIAAALSSANILDFEDEFPERVTRAPLSAVDAALGYAAGEITALDTSLLNVSSSEVEAYDFQVNYTWDTESRGTFDAYVVATLQTTLKSQIISGSETIDRAGFSDGPLEWRGNVGLNWDWGAWAAAWNAQYYDSYKVYSSTATDLVIETTVRGQGSRLVSNQIYHDVFAKYRVSAASTFASGLFADTEISFGIQNLFDESPPILAQADGTGGYSLYGDPRLRRYSLLIRKNF